MLYVPRQISRSSDHSRHILDESIRAVVKGAMEESGAVAIKRYGFDADKHAAFKRKSSVV